MSKPRKITEDTYGARKDVKKCSYYYHAASYDRLWPDRRHCVPHIIMGPKSDVYDIHHGMTVDCECPENSNATVVCYTRMMNGDCYKTFHKPGHCPFMEYEKKEDK